VKIGVKAAFSIARRTVRPLRFLQESADLIAGGK
jgi:hypothetical protein